MMVIKAISEHGGSFRYEESGNRHSTAPELQLELCQRKERKKTHENVTNNDGSKSTLYSSFKTFATWLYLIFCTEINKRKKFMKLMEN